MCDFAPIDHFQSSTQSPVDCPAPQRTRCPCRGVPRGRGAPQVAPAGHHDRNLPKPRCLRRFSGESNGWGDGCWAHWCIGLVRVWVVLVVWFASCYVFIRFTCPSLEMITSCQVLGPTLSFLLECLEGTQIFPAFSPMSLPPKVQHPETHLIICPPMGSTSVGELGMLHSCHVSWEVMLQQHQWSLSFNGEVPQLIAATIKNWDFFTQRFPRNRNALHVVIDSI